MHTDDRTQQRRWQTQEQKTAIEGRNTRAGGKGKRFLPRVPHLKKTADEQCSSRRAGRSPQVSWKQEKQLKPLNKCHPGEERFWVR